MIEFTKAAAAVAGSRKFGAENLRLTAEINGI
jgi:hypothetical protein